MRIGDYECITPFVTAGSGNARWCVAEKDEKEFFLKQFLSPVQPVQRSQSPTERVMRRRDRCAAFETRKLRIYNALHHVPETLIVRIEDFFVHDGHYYAASQYLGKDYQTFSDYFSAQNKIKLNLLLSLAECLKALHNAGIIHADLKPEHIIVERLETIERVRLIDFDSGFPETSPPEARRELDIDPVYMSPEAFRMITGKRVRLNRKLDSFALGILAHQLLCGKLPAFDTEKYAYLYAAVLDGAVIKLSPELDERQQTLIQKLLRKNPAFRPGDNKVVRYLQKMLA